MTTHNFVIHPDASHALDPHTSGSDAIIGAARLAHDEADGVCYCGLYDECPGWVRMNSAERRACSTDKRMTMESLWKGGVQGA